MSVSPVNISSAIQQHDYSAPKGQLKRGELEHSGIEAKQAEAATKTSTEKTSNKPNFLEELLQKTRGTTNKVTPEQMQSRLADIKKMGITLRHHPETSMVKSYITEVRSFLSDVKDNAYEGRKSPEDLFDKIDVVDRKLDELADDFLTSQKPELALIDSLGVLEGLLVDVLV